MHARALLRQGLEARTGKDLLELYIGELGIGDGDFALERAEARQAGDFARADALRDQLRALGVVLKDDPAGTRWTRG